MEDIFIIGHGKSLLNLSEEEKEYIRSRPSFTTSCYLLFHEILNIIPDYLVLPCPIDDYPARNMAPNGLVGASAHVCETSKLKTKWYVHEQLYEYLLNGKLIQSHWQLSCPRVGGKAVHARIQPLTFKPSFEINLVDIGERPCFHKQWATNLDERFFFSSSSATAINLACILYPNHNLKLIGVDGGAARQFYHYASHDGFIASIYPDQLKRHGTKTGSNSVHYSTQFMNIDHMVNNASNHHNCSIYNCNKDSILVEGNDDNDFQAAFLKYRNKKNISKFKYSKILP